MGELLLVNPRKKKSSSKSVAVAAPRKRRKKRMAIAAPIRRLVKRARKSRVARSVKRGFKRVAGTSGAITLSNVTKNAIIPGVVGAAGAFGVDMIEARATFLPLSLRSGIARHATRAAIGIGLGMLVGKVLKKPEIGNQLARGAITVIGYEAMRERFGGLASVSQIQNMSAEQVAEIMNGYDGEDVSEMMNY